MYADILLTEKSRQTIQFENSGPKESNRIAQKGL